MQDKTLNLCVVVSFAVHTICLVVLQTHSLWFYTPAKAEVAASSWTQILEKVSPDQLLQEAFAPRKQVRELPSFSPQKEIAAHPFKEVPVLLNEPPSFTLPASPSIDFAITSYPIQSFQLPAIEQFNFFADLPKDLMLPSPKKANLNHQMTPQSEVFVKDFATPAPSPMPKAPETAVAYNERPSAQVDVAMPRAVPSIPAPNLPQLPSLAELETVNLSDSFDSELSFYPRTDGPGYIFALTLIPRVELNIPKIRQHVVFLLDRSNSIQRDRLQASKHAISRAIEEFDSDVQFNVIAFDSKLDKLFPALTAHTHESRVKANRFLDNIALGSLFSVGDLPKALFLTIPGQVQDDELYTAILLTDGESLSKKSAQRALLRDWTMQNNGRVSLYAVGLEGDPNMASLDATCAINKGKLVSSSTNRGLKRKLMKLAKNIRSPIAKGVASRAVAQSSRSQVNVHMSSSPHLYVDEPYVILGSTETLDDFILFIQARLKTGWLNIKKSISFASAKKGGESLQTQWALQNAYRQYEQYVVDENPNHLAEARKILEPFDIQAIQ